MASRRDISQCSICREMVHNSHLAQHTALHRPRQSPRLTCGNCFIILSENMTFQMHNRHCLGAISQIDEKNIQQCNVCQADVYASRMMQHMRAIHRACDFCHILVPEGISYHEHKKSCTTRLEEKIAQKIQKPFVCKFCKITVPINIRHDWWKCVVNKNIQEEKVRLGIAREMPEEIPDETPDETPDEFHRETPDEFSRENRQEMSNDADYDMAHQIATMAIGMIEENNQ